jgi:hypothetical protein
VSTAKAPLGCPAKGLHSFLIQMAFWCPYCKKSRSGTKGTPEEKTAEHFVPQSISGKWTITVCAECNSRLGSTCDAYLAKVSWLEKLRRNGIVETTGKAILLDGTQVPAIFRIQQLPQSGDPQIHVHSCKSLGSQRHIKKRDLKAVVFRCEKMDSIGNAYPAILKIALAGLVYTAHKIQVYPAIKGLIEGDALDGAREHFLGRRLNFSESAKRAGIQVERIAPDECKHIQASLQRPHTRIHLFQAVQEGEDMVTTIVLFSDFFWRVRFSKVELGVPSLCAETILHRHTSIEDELTNGVVGGHMWIDQDIDIHVAIN